MSCGRKWGRPGKRTIPLPDCRWTLLTLDRTSVAQRVTAHDYDQVMGTGWGKMDDFLVLMEELGTLRRFETMGKGYQRRLIPMGLLLTTYSMKTLAGLSSMNQVPSLLFRDVGLLQRIGFTLQEIQQGFSRRGQGKMRPVHKNTIADALDRLTPEEVEELFNGSIQDLSRAGYLADTVFALDGCELHATGLYPGAGSVTMTLTKQSKTGVHTSTVTRHGYLLCSLWATGARKVAAAKLKPIGSGEVMELLPLVRRAQANLVHKKSRVEVVLADGAYCSGDDLWQLKHDLGVDFVVRANTAMNVCADARGLMHLNDSLISREECADVTAVGVARLNSYTQYAPPKGRKRRGPRATINAVIITKWAGKPVPPGQEVILLTPLPVHHPLAIVDLYHRRSWIENELHREFKQGFYMERFPKKTHHACWSHVFFTLLLYNLVYALQSPTGQGVVLRGIRRLRAETLRTIHTLIVIAAPHFALFDVEEFQVLSGNPPKHFLRFHPP